MTADDTQRIAELEHRLGMVEDPEIRRRHVGVPHELLGEDLAPLDPGRSLRRAENSEPFLLKGVNDPVNERFLRADDGQADLLLLGEADELVELVDVDRDVDAVGRGPGITRRAEDALDAWRLGQLPDEGMFPPALADHQDFHATPIIGIGT